MFASLGIPTYAIRETAKIRADKKKLGRTATEILTLNFLLTLLAYVIVAILCTTVSEIKEHTTLFILMSSNILFVTIGCEWLFQGTEDFKFITIRGLIVKCICVILLFILVRSREDLLYYGLYTVIGVVGGNIWNFIRLRRHISYKDIIIRELRPFSHLKQVSKFFILAVIGSLYLQLDVVMLGFLSDNASVGYYSGALKLTKMVMGIVTSMGIVLLPRFSALSDTDLNSFSMLLNKSINMVVLLSLPMVAGLMVLANPLIMVFCGDMYAPAIPTLIILSPIIFFIGITYIIAQSMIASGRENIPLCAGIIGAAINLILNIALIPRLSSLGAAIATFSTEGAILIFYIVISKKNNMVIPISKDMIKALISTVVMALCILLILNSPLSYGVILCICPILGCLVYAIALYVLKNRIFIDTVKEVKLKFINR